MTRASLAAAALATAALLLSPDTRADTFRDDATGLTIVLPEGMRATRLDQAGYDVVVTLSSDMPRRPIGEDVDPCQVAFSRAPQHVVGTQDQIDAVTVTPARLAIIRAQFGRTFHVASVEPITWGTARGTEVIGTPRMGPDAENARNLISMVETPRGRVVLSCVAHVADTPAIYEVFRTLRAAVKPPA